MNPLDDKKLEELFKLIQIRSQDRITDIGCSKGEMLIRLAEGNEIKGVGVDKSPYCIREAERRKTERVPQADLKFLNMDGADYKPDTRSPRILQCA